METSIHITSDDKMVEALNIISELDRNGRYEVIIKETAKDRTLPQNNALHLYLKMMSKKFIEAGIDQAMAFQKFKTGFKLPATEYFLKEVFQAVAFDMFGEKKTSKLTTKQMIEVYEAFNNGMSVKFGIGIPWPKRKDDQR